MRLYLLRHGQSGGNAGTHAGPDPPLTELGRRQAALAGERLAAEAIEALYCSPLRRALETAAIAGEPLGRAPQVWLELCEKWGEGFRGPALSEIQAAFPLAALPGDIAEEGWWRETGESEEDAYLRAAVVEGRLRRLYEETEKRVLIITHGAFGSVLMSTILGAPPCGYTRFSQHNCGISTIEVEPGRAKLSRLNATDHLPAEALT